MTTTVTIPKVLSETTEHGWLDLRCPSCSAINRLGVRTPTEGKRCKQCDAAIDFWAAWHQAQIDEERWNLNRAFLADALGPEDFR